LKHTLLITLLTTALLACKSSEKEGGGAGQQAKKPGLTPEYQAILANAVPLDRSIDAPGTILPNENTDLHPEISGRVVAINFKEGSFVKAGTLLVKLFDGDLQAQLKKLQVQQQVAEATARRQQELLAINGTSQQDVDNAELTVSNIKADIELLRVNISKTEVRAPYDGRIGLRSISLGAYVSPTTVIANIAQVNKVKVEFSVPEKYAGYMVSGKTVSLQGIDASRTYSASVQATQNTVSVESRNLTVHAVVTNADRNLTPGSFVQVRVDIGERLAAIMIPSQAVIPSTRFKNVIVCENGKASFRVVNTGYRDSARIEIISGLRQGDTVITTGLLTIKEGMAIKPKLNP
jgi:membrane fusion protein (multidrug efflux system)